jgi:glyoxylase-like metal-dependent hydrolase (beta-lactamase superfamily II)/rhodanese-related sulfurtransferase
MDNRIISVKELQHMLDQKQEVFILDVRPIDQRQEWRIAESTHLDAYQRLSRGDNTVLDELNIPSDVTVVTVCAAGKTSLIASEALREKGIKAFSLEGGMKAWNYAWNKAELDLPSGLRIIQVRRPAKGVLSYIAGSAGEAIVIDASLDPEIYLSLAMENGWTIKYVMDTHIHADYISRTRELARASHAKHLFIDKANVDFEFFPVASGESVKFGNASIEFIHTPGHTWESATFKIGGEVIFTGDTLFVDGIGRPDLKAGQDEVVEKAKKLYRSLKQILAFPSHVFVLPAHTSRAIPFDHKLIGEPVSEVIDKLTVMRMEEKEFIDNVLTKIPPTPSNYLTIASLNKKGSYDGHQPADLEAGGNHCAIA